MTSNSSTQYMDCIFWTRGHLNLQHYDSSIFRLLSQLIVVLHCLTFPIASIGNFLVLVAMIATPSLHSIANVFIGALAFSDFLIGAVMQPMTIASLTSRSLFLDCTFQDSLTFIGFLVTSTSVSLMAVVSFERYLCLFLHLRYASLITAKRAFGLVTAVWIYWIVDTMAFFLGGSFFIAAQVFCALAWAASSLIIASCYVKIVLLVRKHQRQIQNQMAVNTETVTETRSQTKLAITMGYVIWASILCYTPTTVVFQMFMFIKEPSLYLFQAFFVTLGIQLMSSSLNPVIYCLRREDIRRAIKGLFVCKTN